MVEATNHKRELFGFERVREISNLPAGAIADIAKQFGQEDDITVIIIKRVVIGEEATELKAASLLAPP